VALFLLWSTDWYWLLALVAATLLYGVTLAALRVFRYEDLDLFRRLLKR
jgi:hypothetical protein